ncbi:hypothetical protein N7507_006297 [Penicillium longicatenatum]|nr:hypothetical protein N7507_006297 [Penicillium longicatenatum]
MAYFEAQALLTTWTDELEYLGYILCELIGANGLDKIGYRYHQAIDLPTLFDILLPQLEEPDGSLVKTMTKNEVILFCKLMRKAKDIRNRMAHHNALNEDQLNDLKSTKQILSDMLEFAIRSVASDGGIYQVAWSPYHHICKAYMEESNPSVIMVPLNKAPLLSIRETVLRDHEIQQTRLLPKRPKRKATEESRQKQKDDYETALIRKQQRKEQDIALRSSQRIEKLQKLEKRFKTSQELGCARIKDIEMQMREEQEIFRRQRAEILKDKISATETDVDHLSTILITISSPSGFRLCSSTIYIPELVVVRATHDGHQQFDGGQPFSMDLNSKNSLRTH